MTKYVVVDIDGTISKVGDRLKYLQQEKKDWDSFYEHCDEDEAYTDMVWLVEMLSSEYDIIFCTGRRESVRDKTLKWLDEHFNLLSEFCLLMRKDNDFRPDVDVKPELLQSIGLNSSDVFLILEDRDKVVDKWRELGYRCLQVSKGDY